MHEISTMAIAYYDLELANHRDFLIFIWVNFTVIVFYIVFLYFVKKRKAKALASFIASQKKESVTHYVLGEKIFDKETGSIIVIVGLPTIHVIYDTNLPAYLYQATNKLVYAITKEKMESSRYVSLIYHLPELNK